MTDTPTPPSTVLRQTAPRHPEWHRHTSRRRQQLLTHMDTLAQQINDLDTTIDNLADNTRINNLYDAIPDVGDTPTPAEWLTRRAAQTEHQLAVLRRDVAHREAVLRQTCLTCELVEAEMQVGQLDDLTEGGPYAAGNEPLMQVMALDVRLAALAAGHEQASLDIAREQLRLIEQVRRELTAALRKVSRAAK
ncbi:hypothetical protein [Micromonospora carbonacea]|uniref:hypothetical protein n=1 Tax=Micromonospora carbonacea TaxID=47853 RepID=UPI003721C740